MRKHNSIFNQVCTFINSKSIGTVFTNDELFSSVDEPETNWKRREKVTATRYYRYWLMKAGVLEKFGKKTWKIVAHVPDHVESRHVWGQKRRTPYQLWHISHENKINKPSDEEITIFIVMKRHVEPVNVFKTQVSALLSTGRYFEDEIDAWYFLSIGTGVAVDSLKAEYRKQQEITKGIMEITNQAKQAEAEEVIALNESIERLDGLLTIRKSGWSERTKIWYGIKEIGDDQRVIKYEVREEQVCKNNMYENESLLDLLMKAAEEVDVDIEDIIDENLQLIEFEIADKALVKAKAQLSEETFNKMFKSEVKNSDKLITIEDIRGREVYYFRHKEWYKGTILSFNFSAAADETPTYGTVKLVGDDETSWIKYSDLFFSKEDVIAQFTQTLNSL